MPLILGTDGLFFYEDDLVNAAESLRTQLALFERGEESCESGLIRLPWSSLMDPASGAGLVDREHDKPSYDYRSYSMSSTAQTSDGKGNSDHLQGQQGSDGSGGRPSYSETWYPGWEYAGVATVIGDAGGIDGADPSSFESGYYGYDAAGVATFLRSSRDAAAAAAAAASAASAAATTVLGSAGATDGNRDVQTSVVGDAFEEYNGADVEGNDELFPAAVTGPDFARYHRAGVDGYYSDSSGDSYGYYYAMISRYEEEAKASSAAAEAAAAASAAAAAASAAVAAGVAANAAAVVNGVSSADGTRGGDSDSYMSYDDAGDEGAFFFGMTRWSGFSPGVGDGVGRVALERN